MKGIKQHNEENYTMNSTTQWIEEQLIEHHKEENNIENNIRTEVF